MHLTDAFIQSDLQYIQALHLYCQYVCSLGIEPTTFALLTQCSNHWATGTLYTLNYLFYFAEVGNGFKIVAVLLLLNLNNKT